MVTPKNLFADLPQPLDGEPFDELLAAPGVRIERIVSLGQATPRGQWLAQDEGEWVIVLWGAAALRFEREAEPVRLGPGDHLHIPAGTRHRVEWTDPKSATVWLAVHHG